MSSPISIEEALPKPENETELLAAGKMIAVERKYVFRHNDITNERKAPRKVTFIIGFRFAQRKNIKFFLPLFIALFSLSIFDITLFSANIINYSVL